jgi:thiamine kinase-like enzyme
VAIEVTTATPSGLHRAVILGIDSIRQLCDEVGDALSSYRRPESVPDNWQPMHGDIAYWNLRRYGTGQVMLLDWESAGWGPPHADLVRALMTAPNGRVVGGGLPGKLRSELGEAAEFWDSRLRANGNEDEPGWARKVHAAQQNNLAPLVARS